MPPVGASTATISSGTPIGAQNERATRSGEVVQVQADVRLVFEPNPQVPESPG